MTKPQRSTRRSVNPPEREQPPEELKAQPQNLAEVESILDEIENLVSKKDQDQTAKSTRVLEDQGHGEIERDDVSGDSETDLGRLEEELHSAIANELETSPERVETDIPEDEIAKITEVFEEAESKRAPKPRFSEPRASTSDTEADATPETGRHEQDQARSGFAALLSRPVQGLSPTMRLVVNITAITLALWVPIIWLVVLRGGFSPGDESPGIEPVPGLVEPVNQNTEKEPSIES